MMEKRVQHDAVQAKRDKANHAQSEEAHETIEQAVGKVERCFDAEVSNRNNDSKCCKQHRRERSTQSMYARRPRRGRPAEMSWAFRFMCDLLQSPKRPQLVRQDGQPDHRARQSYSTRGGSRSSHCQATEESGRSLSAAKQRAPLKLAVAQEQGATTGVDDLNDRDAAQWPRPSEFVTSALRGRVKAQEDRRVPDRAPKPS